MILSQQQLSSELYIDMEDGIYDVSFMIHISGDEDDYVRRSISYNEFYSNISLHQVRRQMG
jgi:hypothetical protein